MSVWIGPLGRRLAAVLVLAVLAACSRPGQPGRPPEPGDQAVAQVGAQTVWASDVRREAVAQGLIGEGAPLDVGSQPFHEVLDEVIDQKLMAMEAARRHLDRDPSVKRRVAASRERIMADALIGRETAAVVNDAAIKSLYDEQVRLAGQTEELHIRQVVSASPQDAATVRTLLAAGQPFDTVASQHSIDATSRDNGGDLGYVAADVLPQAYGAPLAKARPGDLIGPFKSDAGWVVLKLEDRRAETPPSLDQARPQIVSFLHLSRVRDVLESLRRKTPPQLLIARGQSGPEPASAPPVSAAPQPQSTVTPPPPPKAPPSPAKPAAHAPAPPLVRPPSVVSSAPPKPPISNGRDARERLRQKSPPTLPVGPAPVAPVAPPVVSAMPASPPVVVPPPALPQRAGPTSSTAPAAPSAPPPPNSPEKTP